MDNLYFECINILLTLMSLDVVEFYFPGETLERQKLKHKAQHAGLLAMALFIMNNTKDTKLSKYLE